MKRTYYLAYGMNTNIEGMKFRCPNAIQLGKVLLPDHKLQFKYFCDATFESGATMECALWSITDECEKSLDRLEGYPDFYSKKEVSVSWQGKPIRAMIYFMPDGNHLDFPSEHYFQSVVEGYTQHNMNLNNIYTALDEIVKENKSVYCMG